MQVYLADANCKAKNLVLNVRNKTST